MKVAVVWLVLSVLAVSGCNTMRGLGEDMEAAGEAISNKARRD